MARHEMARRTGTAVAAMALTAVALVAAAAPAGAAVRTRGAPATANGASSTYLVVDDVEGDDLVTTDLTVVRPPRTDRLHFWALQVNFDDAAGEPLASVHVGLQWYRHHPGSTAVNFGGYDHDGRELAGTTSLLPSATGNANTRDYPWTPGRPYRLALSRVADGWHASVEDVRTGVETPIRTLHVRGARISSVVLFSEVFDRCDAPRTAVRWSRLPGRRAIPLYQPFAEGGCTNTDHLATTNGITQITNVERRLPAGLSLVRHRERGDHADHPDHFVLG